MNKILLRGTLFGASLYASAALSFPDVQRVNAAQLSQAPQVRAAYDFRGIVALSNCSGSLVRFDDSLPTDPALVLTNGHCIRLLDPGAVIFNQPSTRSFDVLDQAAAKLGTVRARKLLYATMTKTDLALYELQETYETIENKFSIEALTLSRDLPATGLPIEIISGYWKRGYSCAIENIAFQVREGRWLFEDSVRYSRPGCEVIGGTSGSPVVEAGTRTVVAVNNSINERGTRCEVNNPCEVDEAGNILFQRGFGYAQQTFWVYSCRNSAGKLDLAVEGCLLPKPSLTDFSAMSWLE